MPYDGLHNIDALIQGTLFFNSHINPIVTFVNRTTTITSCHLLLRARGQPFFRPQLIIHKENNTQMFLQPQLKLHIENIRHSAVYSA
jgi:hypothetical protein